MDSSQIGYILDFLAGFWIIQAIILRSKRHIKKEAAAFWGGNPFLLESQSIAFWDGWLGVLQLFIGMIFHLSHFDFSLTNGLKFIIVIILISILSRSIIKRKINNAVRKEYPNYDEFENSYNENMV